MSVLIVDDDRDVRLVIKTMLKFENIDVLEAANGQEGMDMVKSNPEINLVITDLIMPEKEGIETIGELKEDYPEMKILAVSGGALGNAQTYLRVAKGMGADAILKKPFTKEELLNAVKSLLKG